MHAETIQLAPDEAEIRAFFEILHDAAGAAFHDVTDPGLLQLSRVHPADEKLVVSGRFQIGAVDAMTRAAFNDALAGHNVYVEGRTVRKDLIGNRRGVLADTRGVFALVVDADADKGRDADLGEIEPSLSVESSPGNRHHWFFLDRALSAAESREIGERLRHSTGADDDTGNPTQPYRVAGTPNFPGPKKRARGRVPSPTSILTEGRDYSADDLRDALGNAGSSVDETPAGGPSRDAGRAEYLSQADHAAQADRPLDELMELAGLKRLDDLAATGVADRSAHFLKVTGWLKGDGFSENEAVALWSQFPAGAGVEKYGSRLAREVGRVWQKTSDDPNAAAEGAATAERMAANGNTVPGGVPAVPAARRGNLIALDEDLPYVHQPELVRDTLPLTGTAFIGGQSGAGKTFLAIDLGMKIMTGEPFAGRKIERTGGVLYVAGEGAGSISKRMKAARSRLADPSMRLPFMMLDRFGPVNRPSAFQQLLTEAMEARRFMLEEFGAPLRAIFFDTVIALQMIPDDRENDATAWSKVSEGLNMISDETGALSIPIHHYGKTASAGLRGSSGIRGGTESVLALTCERDEVTGDVSNRLLSLTKHRDAPEGALGPVTLHPVVVGHREDGSDVTSMVLDIDTGTRVVNVRLAKKSQAERIFDEAFAAAILDHLQSVHVYGEAMAPIVKAVDLVWVREEFDRRYVASADDEKKRRETVRKQLKAGLQRSMERRTVCSGSWGGIEWVWAATKAGEVDLTSILAAGRRARSGTE